MLLVFVAMCSVFWLFWLSFQYLPSDWLERLLWGSLIVARGSSPESPGRRVLMIFLIYCIVSLFYYVSVLSPGPAWYIFLLLWHDIACLCWKCRWTPSKQTSEIGHDWVMGGKKDIYRDVRFFHGSLQLRVRKTYSFNGTLSILIWVSRHQKHRISIHLTASLSLLHVVSQ